MSASCHLPRSQEFRWHSRHRRLRSAGADIARPRAWSSRALGTALRLFVAAWVAGLGAFALSATPARADDTNQVKADMLWNIAKFIKWPESAFVKGESDFVFTILGDDSLAEALAASLSTRTLNGRPVFVRIVGRVQDVTGSQILYIATSALARLPDVIRELHGGPALTVANSPRFVESGGMVDFVAEDDKVRFEIHQARAEKAGLKISARLLAIARVVESDPAASR